MSEKTRVKRPTTSTPRKNPPGRMIHQSTNIFFGSAGSAPIKMKGSTRRTK